MKQLNWYQIFGNVHIIPEGSTVTPTDDIQILLHCANIWDKSYTTIGEVIADDDTLFLTLIDNNAIDYLVRSTTFASSIVADEESMEYIGASDYASETLLSDSTWNSAVHGSLYASYVENVSVPAMTDNTHPSGECFCTESRNISIAYRLYDGVYNLSGGVQWPYCNLGNQRTGYNFGRPVTLHRFWGKNRYDSTIRNIYQYKLQGSNDGSTWVDITDVLTNTNGNTNAVYADIFVDNANSYNWYCLNPLQSLDSNNRNEVHTGGVQFYGREIGGVQSWLKAGGITNKKYTTVSEVLSDLTTLATLMASTDAIDYLVTAKGWATEICSDSNAMADIGMNNYAANTLLADETWRTAICESTYFTSVLNVSVPTMTDDTHPYGTASASDVYSSSYKAYQAFNGLITPYWASTTTASVNSTWLRYQFPSAVRIYKAVSYIQDNRATQYKVQSSNDNITWTDRKTMSVTQNAEQSAVFDTVESATSYQFLYTGQSTTNRSFNMLYANFYGRKDI